MEEIIIKVSESEEGYMYDIYIGDEKYMECESEDGGLCTTSMKNALEMAYMQAQDIIKAKGGPACDGCGRFIGTGPALSRYGHGDICSSCGTREALEGDFIKAEKETV